MDDSITISVSERGGGSFVEIRRLNGSVVYQTFLAPGEAVDVPRMPYVDPVVCNGVEIFLRLKKPVSPQ
jgi:hypothetical protein